MKKYNVDEKIEQKIENLGALLESIKVSENKKKLWLEIYHNAISDRKYAEEQLQKLIGITGDDSSEHAIHGKSMATYIEKMTRSNDQILRLAELINSTVEKDNNRTVDDFYDELNQSEERH